LLTGRTPFSGGTPQSVLTRQITELPAPVERHRSSVPPELSAAIMRCLEKRPADRWQSAGELLAALRAARMASSVQPPVPGAGPETRGRRRFAPPAIAAAVLLVSFAGWSVLGGAELDGTSRVVVDVFENQTGDVTLDRVGLMLQDWLTDGLLQSGLMEVVPTITARQAATFVRAEADAGRPRDPVMAIADETGAEIVISGTVYMDGDKLRIRTSVTEATDRQEARLVGSIEPVVGPVDDITALLAQVRERLLGSLATSLNRRIAAQVGVSDRAPTYEAYEALNDALDFYSARDYSEASALFLRAFELDPTYPVPLVYASLSLRNHNEWARSDSVVTLLEDRREELSEYQRHWVDYSRAVLEGDLDRARITIRRAATLAPASKAVYNWSLMAIRMGRPMEARTALETLEPDRGAMRGISRYWMRRIEASHHLGDHERELEEVEELASRYPEERSIFVYRVRVYAALGWTESLKALFATEAVSRFPPEIVAIRYRGAAIDLFAHGHREEAREFAELGISWIDSRTTTEGRASSFNAGVALDAREELAYQKGRLLEILGDRDQALTIYEGLYEGRPEAWFVRAHMGVLLGSLGRISDAMDVDRWLEARDAPYASGEVTTWRAGIAAGLGDRERATALLQQARQEGMPWLNTHAVFQLHDVLGDYQPYIDLMAPQG
jgi:tetratricopeptide (TPR) repeat protein